MDKKLFVTFSILLVLLFVATAVFRYMGSMEFEKLRTEQPEASRDLWERYSNVCMKLMSATRIACRIYPLFALSFYLSQGGGLKKTLLITLGVFAIGSLAVLAVSIMPGASVTAGNGAYFMLTCLFYWLVGAVPCVIAAVLTKRKIASQ